MEIIKTYKNIDLIKINDYSYVVRKRSSFFGFKIVTYFCTCYNGTDLTFGSIANNITIADLERAEYIFNCNVIKMGGI